MASRRLIAQAMPAIAFLFPLVVVQANKAAVIVLVLAGLLGLWNVLETRSRPVMGRDLVVWGMAGFLVWGAMGVAWAFTPGLVLPQVLALAGLILAGGLALRAAALAPADRLLSHAMAGMIAASVITWADMHSGYHLTSLLHAGKGEMIPGRFKAGTTILALWAAALVWAGLAQRRWVLSLAALASVLVLARATDSLAATMALGGGLCIGLGTLALPRIMPGLVGAAAVIGLLAAPVAVHMPAPKDLISRFPILPNSTLHRAMIWHFVAEKVMERPILGWGLDGSRAIPGGEDDEVIWLHLGADRIESMPQQRLPLHPHNAPLQVWVETGLVGALIFAAILAGLAARCHRVHGLLARACVTAALASGLAIGAVGYGVWQAWWLASLWLTGVLCARLVMPPKASSGAAYAA